MGIPKPTRPLPKPPADIPKESTLLVNMTVRSWLLPRAESDLRPRVYIEILNRPEEYFDFKEFMRDVEYTIDKQMIKAAWNRKLEPKNAAFLEQEGYFEEPKKEEVH